MITKQPKHLGTRENPKPVAHTLLVASNQKICLENNPKLRGLSFIGGKVEKGETSTQAIIREIREETGNLVSLHADDLVLVDSNIEYFPQMLLAPGSKQGTWFIGDLYVGKISDTLLSTLETTRKNISTGWIVDYQNRNSHDFGGNKEDFLKKIQLCQDVLKRQNII